MNPKIYIRRSLTADTRSCDFSKVSKEQLRDSTIQHIGDVITGIDFLRHLLAQKASAHDHSKLEKMDQFYKDFQGGFRSTVWWDDHVKSERHHLFKPEGVPPDVNLLDVLECIVDCVVAGKARTGTVYPLEFSPALLYAATTNTVKLLIDTIQVEE